ncbi:MAG: mannosyltransferase [Thelocarpon superellum]|nr:MAG: mannosyltransferase [Thelocarpon superellum]
MGVPLVSITAIPPPPRLLRTENKLLFLVYGPLKVLWQVWSLWLILGYRTKAARWLLVQNPPSIPSLAIAYLVCLIRDTHLLIDWHNFGWSILAMRLGEAHPLVSVAKRYESFFGGFASANFTVTDAMARVLKEDFHIASPILTLHDRPPAHFQPLSPSQRASFLARLPETAPHAQDILAGRTKLLVSATSWTADEDFSILLDALISYSASTTATTAAHLPQILAIITGKGPQKAHYLSQISSHTRSGLLRNIIVQTAWLSAADYASLLGSADLGVSLHTSSSGVDLPMKVVDMFGAGLPVVGWSDFEAWKELVREGQNGRGFQSAQQLADVLRDLFAVELALMGDRAAGAGGAWERNAELKRLKEGTMKEGAHRWEDEWVPVAGRILGLCD